MNIIWVDGRLQAGGVSVNAMRIDVLLGAMTIINL
jgi:hypothetical protein